MSSKKALKAVQRRELAAWMQERFKINVRRSCRLALLQPSVWYQKSEARDQSALRLRIREIAMDRPRFGYLRVLVMLKREGWAIGKKRVYRLYRLEGLQLRMKVNFNSSLERGCPKIDALPFTQNSGSLRFGGLLGFTIHPMKIELNPEWLRTSMSMIMWRDAADMKIPIHDSFKVHFLEERGTLLDGFVKTSTAWLTVLRTCKALGEDQAALESLLADVETFKKWAEDGLSQLSNLAMQESLKDNVQQMIQDSNLGSVVRKSLMPEDAGKNESSE